MNKLDDKLKELKQSNKLGLMAHVVVGYPSLSETKDLVEVMADNGADIIELQIPFSDPLADGPTIMRACEQALAQGTKVKDAFVLMQTLSKKVSTPLLFMAYYNTVFQYGVQKFCRDAQAAGATGLIVPDMPLDEEANEHFFAACKKYNVHHIQVVAPASTEERLRKNAAIAKGFVYCTARQGTTGAKDTLDPQIGSYLQRVKKILPVPLAVGFGISSKEHINSLKGYADVAVIGSKVIDIIAQSSRAERLKRISNFFQSLVQ